MNELLFELPGAMRQAEKVLANRFLHLCKQTREDILQDAVLDILKMNHSQQAIRHVPALLVTIAVRKAGRVHHRSRHDATPVLTEDGCADCVLLPHQHADFRRWHDLPKMIRQISIRYGGRNRARMTAALEELTATDEDVGPVAASHGIDRALLSRARCALWRAWLA